MSGFESTAVGIVILVLLLVFVGIWIWAWLPYHKRNFDSLARIPMLDLVTSDQGVAPDEANR